MVYFVGLKIRIHDNIYLKYNVRLTFVTSYASPPDVHKMGSIQLTSLNARYAPM